MNQVKIVSDGTAKGTKVLIEGKELKYIKRLEISPLIPNKKVTAIITIQGICFEMDMKKNCVDFDYENDLKAIDIQTALLDSPLE